MKIIKPLSQSILYKVFEADKKFFLSASVISHFTFNKGPLLSEQDLWRFIPDELGKEAILDNCMPKTNGEVLISGKCYAPEGNATGSEISVTIASINKKLYVFGNRCWKKDILYQDTITAPEHFKEIPVTWEHAFGGRTFPHNPLGKGAAAEGDLHQLPNVEYADRLICSPSDKPPPASFGPVDMMWPVRMKKAGTYDESWRKQLFPGLPCDIDYSFFNTAPQDQWLHGYFTGCEFFEIRGMHPSKNIIQSSLPSIKSRCFINRKKDDTEIFEELKMELDTVWLFPHSEKGVLIWRGVTEIFTDDAEDVLHMMVGYERLTDEPKSFDHYKTAFLKRIDEENGNLYILNERDLIPFGEQSLIATLLKNDKPESALSKNLATKAEKVKEDALKKRDEALAKVKEKAQAAGVDPLKIIVPVGPAQDLPEIPALDMENFDPDAFIEYRKKIKALSAAQEFKAQKAIEAAKVKKDLAKLKIKEICEKQGVDFNKIMDRLTNMDFKRPLFSASSILEKLRKTKENVDAKIKQFTETTGVSKDTLMAEIHDAPEGKHPLASMMGKLAKINPDDPVLLKNLSDAELSSKEMYRKSAHFQPKPTLLSAEEAAKKRARFLAMIENKESFKEQDFSGADLQGVILTDCNLQNIYLEDANLSNVHFKGVNLSGAILTRTDLSNAVFTDTTIAGANTGSTICNGTRFINCDCTDAIFGKALFTDAAFNGCNLSNVDFLEAVFTRIDFSHSQLSEAKFIERDLTDANFTEANCSKSIFIKPILENASFCKATLENTVFIEALATNTDFSSSNCSKAIFLSKSKLTNAVFTNANCSGVNMMEADCTNTRFIGTILNNANLMKAVCKDADFSRISGIRSNLMKIDFTNANLSCANLFEANLKGSILVGASLKNANLFSAELFRITIGDTSFDGSNLKKTKLEEWSHS